MSKFHIKKLTITGQNKKDSVVNFEKGLNIVYGPSNTGKSYIVQCIDYLFGSSDNPIDTTTGYNCIHLTLDTENGIIKLSRKLDENTVIVFSENEDFSSGKYKLTGKDENNLCSLWLKLIGINKQHTIIKNKNFQKRNLTWRTFSHILLLSEERIISKNSILLPKVVSSYTATLSSLIFLITGNDFGNITPTEDKKIKDAQIDAVVKYINKELSDLAERREEIDDFLAQQSVENIDVEINKIITEIEDTEKLISNALNKNQELLLKIYSINENLAESKSLYCKYQELKSQYISDKKRLSLVIDGQANELSSNNTICPFCDGPLKVNDTPDYIEASKSEYSKLSLQLEDLNEASDILQAEIVSAEKQLINLEKEKTELDNLISKDLQPKISMFKEKLYNHRLILERENELKLIADLSASMNKDIIDTTTDKESKMEFKPKEHFNRTILDILDEYLSSLFEKCNISTALTVRFNRDDMDIVVNGKKKQNEGKGYRALYNTILATAFNKYLNTEGQYAPGFLIVDSPILSLKEPDSQVTDSMKKSLFQYYIDNQEGFQTIIIENDLPQINYNNCHMIHFTKDKNNGRYGLLNDVFN